MTEQTARAEKEGSEAIRGALRISNALGKPINTIEGRPLGKLGDVKVDLHTGGIMGIVTESGRVFTGKDIEIFADLNDHIVVTLLRKLSKSEELDSLIEEIKQGKKAIGRLFELVEDPEIARMVLSRPAVLRLKNEDGLTVADDLASYGSTEIIKEMLGKAISGDVPLREVLAEVHTYIVGEMTAIQYARETLRRRGVDFTPYDKLAEELGQEEWELSDEKTKELVQRINSGQEGLYMLDSLDDLDKLVQKQREEDRRLNNPRRR